MPPRKGVTKASEPDFQKALGEVIRETRKPVSQDDFADVIGVYRSHMGRIEQGQLNLRLSTLIALANGLKMPLSQLMTLAEERLQAMEEDSGPADQSPATRRSGEKRART